LHQDAERLLAKETANFALQSRLALIGCGHNCRHHQFAPIAKVVAHGEAINQATLAQPRRSVVDRVFAPV
jgi:hypothetical protein